MLLLVRHHSSEPGKCSLLPRLVFDGEHGAVSSGSCGVVPPRFVSLTIMPFHSILFHGPITCRYTPYHACSSHMFPCYMSVLSPSYRFIPHCSMPPLQLLPHRASKIPTLCLTVCRSSNPAASSSSSSSPSPCSPSSPSFSPDYY